MSQFLFHPRPEATENVSRGIPTATDSGGVRIGGYLHVHPAAGALLLFFHGNGEIAADYEFLAEPFTACVASFWAVGLPRIRAQLGTAVLTGDDRRCGSGFCGHPCRCRWRRGSTFPVSLSWGGPLGSASALYLASVHTAAIDGLLLDSPFASGPDLIRRLGGPAVGLAETPDLEDNLDRMRRCDLPTAIIHGTDDVIIPVSESRALYNACPGRDKTLLTIEGAGHNDLLVIGFDRYFDAVRHMIAGPDTASG